MRHMRATRCGRVLHAPLDVVLGSGAQREVVQPDILYVDRARAAIITKDEVAGAPDLVIEVLSPGTKRRDRGNKRTLYERSGVREYWIVDPESSSAEVYSLGPAGFGPALRYAARGEMTSAVVPNFTVALAEVFERWD
jgi:Uma2 family endonuclease